MQVLLNVKKRLNPAKFPLVNRAEVGAAAVVPAQDIQTAPEKKEPEVVDLSANLPKPVEYYRAKRAKWLAGKPIKREIVPNPKHHPLPDGFRKVVPDMVKLPLTIGKIPWLKEGNGGTGNGDTTISLALVTLSDTGNRQFYLGSYIRHRVLLEATENLTGEQSDSVNQLFYSCLPDIVRNNYNPKVKTVENPHGGVSIFYRGNRAGQRAYFMRFDSINGLPVIVKVAVCDKERQGLVLSVLTTQEHKNIKKLGGLN
ncbi:hypothetical protein HYU93_01965 [Candidatus Daviesbacteria bacterium]|nr:hypothetical protein [Candidatus Daviesbacteria bacterium]